MKNTPQSNPPPDLSLEIARAIIAEASKRPWLASLLLHREQWLTELAERLHNLSRQTRRVLRRAINAGMAAAVLAATFLWAQPVRAATITVDGSTCTLANAIMAANLDMAYNGCSPGSGADSLDLQTNVMLISALPDISTVITIEGNDHTISRYIYASDFSVITVTSSGNLTIKNATITDGSNPTGHGGGIQNEGTLTVEGCTIQDNTAYNGGGIHNSGTLTVTSSTISGNTGTYDGGGIKSDTGTAMNLQDSTISGNSNTGNGGGGGVAIYSTNGAITNCTISGNSSTWGGGGIVVSGSTSLDVIHSTITNNTGPKGGGVTVVASGTVTFKNSIIAEQSSGVDCYSYFHGGYAFYSDDYNIESATTCVLDGSNDQQEVNSEDLNLGSLADNSGPTNTHALGSGSYAIDQISNGTNGCVSGTSTDQRGAVRANGASKGGTGCDVGAYEYDSNQTPTALTLNNLSASMHSPTGIIAALSAAFVALGAGWISLFRKRKAQGT